MNRLVFEPAFKVFGQREGGWITALRIFLETLETDGREVAVCFWIPQPRVPRFGFQKQSDSIVGCSSGEGWMASKQMVKHRAQSIHVCCGCELAAIAQRLFRRHVTRRAQRFNCAGDSALSFSQPRQAEVGKVRFTFCIDQNVSWLNVSMENAALMRVMHSARELGNQFRCAADRHRFAPNELVERAAFNQFHAEVARPTTLANFVNGNDVRIIQTRRSFRFQLESLEARLRSPLARADNL